MRSAIAILAVGAVAVSAQINADTKYNSSLEIMVDPATVTPADRATWCQAQTNSCFSLCLNNEKENGCDPMTLKYECTCASNSSAPALQYYTQTMPTFMCQAYFSQCNQQFVGNAREQKACKDNIQSICGTIDVPNVDDSATSTAESSTTAAATSSTKASSTASSGATTAADAASTTKSDGLAAATAIPGALIAAAGFLAVLV